MKNTLFVKILFILSFIFVFASIVHGAVPYEYTITKMELQDSSGNVFPQIPTSGNFYIKVTIRDNISNVNIAGTSSENMLILAFYAADGTFLDLTYVRFSDSSNREIILSTLIKPNGYKIATIKGFIWNSFAGMKPLSRAFTYGETASTPDVPEISTGTMTLDNSTFDKAGCTISNLIETDTSVAFKHNATLKYFTTQNSTSSTAYAISETAAFYVNGVAVEINKSNLERFILNNPIGKIELTDFSLGNGEYDFIYDRIDVEYFATAQINKIKDNKISFSSYADFDSSYIDLNTAEYKLYLSDDEVSLDWLGEGDIISFKYDVTAANSAESSFFEVYCSTKTFTKTLAVKSKDTVAFDSEKYTFVFPEQIHDMIVGYKYTVRADIFNRIFEFKRVIDTSHYAIITKFDDDTLYDYGAVQVLRSSGKPAIYPLHTAEDARVAKEIAEQTDVTKRVIQFTTYNNAMSDIISLEAHGNGTPDTFNFSTNNICGINFTANAVLFDASNFSLSDIDNNIIPYSFSYLRKDVEYLIYGFGDTDESDAYHFAIMTTELVPFDAATPLAVVKYSPSIIPDESGNDMFKIIVEEDSFEQTLYIKPGTPLNNGTMTSVTDLNVGDVIVYRVDAEGYAKKLYLLFSALDASYDTAVESYFQAVASNTGYAEFPADVSLYGSEFDDWTLAWNPLTENKISLIYAPIVAADNYSLTIAQIDSSFKTNMKQLISAGDAITGTEGKILKFDIEGDTRVVSYDYSSKLHNRVYSSTFNGIIPTDISPYYNKSTGIIDWQAAINGGINIYFVFVKAVNGIATDVVVFGGDNYTNSSIAVVPRPPETEDGTEAFNPDISIDGDIVITPPSVFDKGDTTIIQ